MTTKKKKAVIPKSFYRKEISRDVNYFAVKQKLKSLGFDLFNYVKPKKNVVKAENQIRKNKTWHNIKKLIYALYVENYFDYKDWIRFCKVWNFYINGAVRYGS